MCLEWTHAICVACWNVKNPNRKPITALIDTDDEMFDETCCYCGKLADSPGIYVRDTPMINEDAARETMEQLWPGPGQGED